MDVVRRAWSAIPWRRFAQELLGRSVERILVGVLLGITAAAGLQQYQSQWGTSGPMARGAIASLILGWLAGTLVQRYSRTTWPLWLAISATISLVLPSWFDQTAVVIAWLPDSLAEHAGRIEFIGFSLAIVSLALPAVCWSACFFAILSDQSSHDSQKSSSNLIRFAAGCAAGVFANAFLFGPLLSEDITTIAAAVLGFGISYRAWSRRNTEPVPQPVVDHLAHAVLPCSFIDAAFIVAACVVCGGALSLSQRLINLLVPQTVYLQQSAWSVVLVGLAAGVIAGKRWPHSRWRIGWATLMAVAGLAITCGGFPWALSFRLWGASYLINATLHQLACVALLAVCFAPISFAAGLLIDARRPALLAAGIAGLLFGWRFLAESAAVIDEQQLVTLLGWAGIVVALVAFLSTQVWLTKRREAGLAAGGVAVTAFAVLFLSAGDVQRSAKILFSTSSFLASRAGWKMEYLPHLDDSRPIAGSPSRAGAMTLWKSRGIDLMVREAGVPRSLIAARPDLSPQAAAEVLQVVFPLVVAEEKRNVLLLGSSGGIPLSTCLGFPVEHVTCVEPESARVAFIRGPIAAERGYDPFADDRVQRDSRPIELSAAMSDGRYDIILSCPPLSILSSAAPQFSQEFYQRVSRKLTPEGVFCQRFEAVDYGAVPLQIVVKSLQRAFRNLIAIEIGVGDYLFLATNSERGLVPRDLPERLEADHVCRILARCGWDWSTLLTLPAWDHAALQEFAAEGGRRGNTVANCQLAFTAPREMLRWGPKLDEVQRLLTKPKTSSEASLAEAAADSANPVAPSSRRSRYLDWLGDQAVSRDVLRRLSEVVAQTKIIQESPDKFWLDYRKVLREEIQQRPRTEIRQVAATEETERVLHREDERRKEYFTALGKASNLESRNLQAVYELEKYFQPYDPLLSLFARQETAELLAVYGHPDPAAELQLRLHVINFAPAGDRSLRNVMAAMELILARPECAADPQFRFDTLNGLIQSVRTRWEARSTSEIKSVRFVIQEVDRSIVTIEKSLTAMDQLRAETDISLADWELRKAVIERALLRPLRGCRADLLPRDEENRALAEAAKEKRKNKK